MLYLRELMQTAPFDGSYIIAGERGLENIVGTATIAEVPDAASWLTGNELVCTSGYLLKGKKEQEIVEWFKQISDNASGLIIKLNSYINEIPSEAIAYANEVGFPIIAVKLNVSWHSIIDMVIEWTSSYKKADYLKEIREKYTNTILLSNDISEIVDIIYEDFLNPTFIYDAKLNQLAQASKVSNKYGDLYTQIIEKYGKRKILLSEYYEKVVSELSVDIRKFYMDEIEKPIYIIPIVANKVLYGFLIVLGIENELASVEYDALEYLSNLLSIKFTNQSLLQEESHEDKNTVKKIVENIVNRKKTNEKYRVVLFTDEKFGELDQYNLKESVETFIKEMDFTYKLAFEENLIVLFLILEADEVYEKTNILNTMLENILDEYCLITKDDSLKIVISNLIVDHSDLMRQYELIKEGLRIDNLDSNRIVYYENLGISRLYEQIKDMPFIDDYVSDYLTPILNIGDASIFIETLFQYLKSGGSISMAAKAMYVHPNTILYRMKKIKELIGDPLRNPDYQHSLLLALELYFRKNRL